MPANQTIERLITEYGDSIFRMCYLYLRDYHHAEDAVQETFIKAMRYYDSYEGRAEEKTWLIRIAINTCKNMMRTRWFQRKPLEEYKIESTEIEIDGTNPEERVIENLIVSQAIMELPVKDREVLILYYYQEFKIKEIAQIIGKSESVAAQRLQRSRMKLKKILEREEDEL